MVCGDTPLLRAGTLHDAARGARGQRGGGDGALDAGAGAAAATAASCATREAGWPRIVEERDATDEQRAIDEVNSGIYAFHYPALAGRCPR